MNVSHFPNSPTREVASLDSSYRGAPRICAFFHDKDDSIRHFAAETLGANGNEALILLFGGGGVWVEEMVPKQVGSVVT